MEYVSELSPRLLSEPSSFVDFKQSAVPTLFALAQSVFLLGATSVALL